MTDDIVTRIREQANAGYIDEHEVMLRIAADEIERLQTLIIAFVDAERNYEDDWQDAYNHPDDSASVMIKGEWRQAWSALYAEADSIKEIRDER